jgi:hypothetical protein
MFCSSCGKENAPGVAFCSHCGARIGAGIAPASPGVAGSAVAGPGVRREIPSYLAQAILVTLFCCLPFGIVSIVYAAQVNGKAAAGDVAGATSASNSARTWAWVSFWVGAGVGGLYILAMIGAGVLGALH